MGEQIHVLTCTPLSLSLSLYLARSLALFLSLYLSHTRITLSLTLSHITRTCCQGAALPTTSHTHVLSIGKRDLV